MGNFRYKMKKYDKNSNLIYYKDSYGFESWQEYDKNNNEIYFKNTNGIKVWYEYDENNNVIHYKDSTGFENWRKYDENNKRIGITKKEFNFIKQKEEEKEYLARDKYSRFEILDIR